MLVTKVMEFCIDGMPHVLKAVAEDVDKFPRAPASFRNSTTFVLEVMKKKSNKLHVGLTVFLQR